MPRTIGLDLRKNPPGLVSALSALRMTMRCLTLLVRVEDVVLRFHWRMARISAVWGAFGVGSERVRRSVVVEHRISPAAAFRESLAVLLHHKSLRKDIGHIHGERRFRAFLRLPLEFRDHVAIRKWRAVSQHSGLKHLDHRWIADDYLKDFLGKRIFGTGGRDH